MAPSIVVQDASRMLVQRFHAYVKDAGVLIQSPVVVVSVAPTCGLPLRTGRVVLSGRMRLTWTSAVSTGSWRRRRSWR